MSYAVNQYDGAQCPTNPAATPVEDLVVLLAHLCRDRQTHEILEEWMPHLAASLSAVALHELQGLGEAPFHYMLRGLADVYQHATTLPQSATQIAQCVEAIVRREVYDAALIQPLMQQVHEILQICWEGRDDHDLSLTAQLAILTAKQLLLRRVNQELRQLDGFDGDMLDPAGRHQRRQELVEREAQILAIGQITLPTIDGVLPDYYQSIQQHRGRQLLGLNTGFAIFNDRFCGLRDLLVVAARSGVGKTTLVQQIAVNSCRLNDVVVIYLSLDMGRDSLLDKLHCQLAEMDWTTYRLGSADCRGALDGQYFNQADQHKLAQATERLSAWGLRQRYIILDWQELASINGDKLARLVRQAKQSTGATHALIVVDYLQLLPVPEALSRQSELEIDKARIRVVQDALATLNKTGGSINAAIAISEARKPSTSAKRNSWASSLEDVMGTARTGYAAAAVLLMRPPRNDEILEQYGDEQGCSVLERLESQGVAPVMLDLVKCRSGMTRGKWTMEFDYRLETFYERVTHAPAVPEDNWAQWSGRGEVGTDSIVDAIDRFDTTGDF